MSYSSSEMMHYRVQELGHHETGRASADQQGVRTRLGSDLLQPVHGAGGGLD